MIRAIELSKYIINKCVEDRKPISNLQLQKILYYIQYNCLKKTGNILFRDDIEAWQFGPVIPDIYYHFCGFGSMRITVIFPECKKIDVTDKIKNIIDDVIEDKREINPWDMVKETHRDNGPWSLTFKNGEGNKKVISIESIRQDIKGNNR